MKIIGIDLGTTNSAVSLYEMGTARTLQLKGDTTIPSVIWVNPQGDYVVGREAKQHVCSDPDHILISTKRDLGSDKVYNINSESFTPTDAATILLAYLRKEASKSLQEEISDAVITVPAYFGFQEIGEVKKAAINAGLNPLQIIPEPTAAAIRYGIGLESNQYICVIDLGGGTFDVTVLEISFDKLKSKHTISPLNWDGDHYLGGDDFDNAIIEWIIQNGARGFKNKLELKKLAEEAKIELSSLSATTISHPVYLPAGVTLTRDEFKSLIQDKLEQIGNTIKKTIKDCAKKGKNIDSDDINRFILVGGSCKHILVRDYIKEIIGRDPFNAPNLDTYVAEGAALYHHQMKTPGGRLEVDTFVPKTLGALIQDSNTNEMLNSILINKGEKLPARAVSLFYTNYDNQEVLTSNVIEGSERLASNANNKMLDQITANLSFVGPIHPVVFEYNIDLSGLLSFNCYELNVTQANVEDVVRLQVSLSENVLNPEDWDTFYNKYKNDTALTHIELSLFNK